MKRHVRANWSEAVLVCAKCEKKLKRGFGAKGKQTLAKALKACAGGKGRKARFGVVPVSCLKICPKRAVTVVRGSLPGAWQIVEAGTPIPAVMARLGLDHGEPDARSDSEATGQRLADAVTPSQERRAIEGSI